MKKILILLLLPLSSMSQTIDGLKFQMGPKIDKFYAETGQVEMLPHLDVSAGLFLYKELVENWRLNIGIIKHDYSAKFQIKVNDANTGREETFFKNYVFPTYTSYQLGIMPSYRHMITNDLAVYGSAGVLLYLSKKLSRTGIDERTEELIDPDMNQLSALTLTTYNNSFNSGNFILRADAGLLIGLKEYLALDISLNGRFSTLEHGGFKLEYTDDQGVNRGEDRIYTKAGGVGMNIGLQLQFN